MTGAGIMLIALGIEAAVGWPKPLFALIGHPVTWIGKLISRLDKWLNLSGTKDRDRRVAGAVAAVLVIVVAAALGLIAQWLFSGSWWGFAVLGLMAWPLVAARSMHDHVAAVARPLEADDVIEARRAVAMIVGRDPARLDARGIARAALESLAENASDGVIAPLFWGAIFGLPGIAAYKAINTLDSMIGHRTPKYEAFGWASARIDDVANLIPARLTGLLFAAVSAAPRAALACMVRDARHHRSPNAGWPEAAMAGALKLRLAGPIAYDGVMHDKPWIGDGDSDAGGEQIDRALAIYLRACLLLWLIAGAAAWLR